MNKIPVDILKNKIFIYFKNEIACCTDKTLYNLMFVNNFFKKILSNNTFVKKIYKLSFLNNINVCTKCNDFDLFQLIDFYKFINREDSLPPDLEITPNIYNICNNKPYEGYIHFRSNKEFNNFEMFLLKNNIKKLLLIAKCCGGRGGNFKYVKS